MRTSTSFGVQQDAGRSRTRWYFNSEQNDDEAHALMGSKAAPESSNSLRRVGLFSSIFVAAIVALVVVLRLQSNDVESSNAKTAEHIVKMRQSLGSLTTGIPFSLKRVGYHSLGYFSSTERALLKYKILENHLAIIEPHQEMELWLSSDSEKSLSSTTLKFQICPMSSTSVNYCVTANNGDSVSLPCEAHETFRVTLYEVLSSTDATETLAELSSGSAVCLYVRRELRQLSSADTKALVRASYEVSSLSEEEGQRRFGSDFQNATHLARLHFVNAAQQMSDHIHEGNGFLMQHVKLTNLFDDTLRAVDASVTLPYWDFTIDNAQDLPGWQIAPFSASAFGESSPPVDKDLGFRYDNSRVVDGRIMSGFWANTKVETNYLYPELKSGYGYMRSPWSMNPSPYLSRFAVSFNVSLPSCADHYALLQFTDLMDFFLESSFSSHGAVHAVMGGFYGCDVFDPLVESGYVNSKGDAKALCSQWDFYMKEFYRANQVLPQESCVAPTVSTPSGAAPTVDEGDAVQTASCGFTCRASAAEIFTFLKPQISEFADVEKEGAQQVWGNFVCSGPASRILTGDHLESSSAADPSFWVIHPTLERLLHAKLLSGGFSTSAWASDSRTEYVCNHANCIDSETGQFSTRDECCYGHYENDRLQAASGKKDSYEGLSNAELLQRSDPRSADYSMPYVYDHFQWPHCDAQSNGDSASTYAQLLSTLVQQGAAQVMPALQISLRADKMSMLEGDHAPNRRMRR